MDTRHQEISLVAHDLLSNTSNSLGVDQRLFILTLVNELVRRGHMHFSLLERGQRVEAALRQYTKGSHQYCIKLSGKSRVALALKVHI